MEKWNVGMRGGRGGKETETDSSAGLCGLYAELNGIIKTHTL